VQTLTAEDAGAVAPLERRNHKIAGLDRLNPCPDDLDDADELVPHATARFAWLHRSVWPEIATADPCSRHANERVGRFDQACIGDVLDANVTRPVHDSRTHGLAP